MGGSKVSILDMILHRDRTVLVTVDLQERLLAAMPRRDEVTASALRLVRGCGVLDLPMVVTEQYPRGLGRTVPELAELLPEPVEKSSFDCCGEPRFLEMLEALGRDQVLMCGSESHICVLQTCLTMLSEGYSVHVAADAVCSRRDSDRDLSLETMRQAGAVISSVETALFQLLGGAGNPEFKEISLIVR